MGEWLTRGSIWLALTLYVASECAGQSGDSKPPGLARWLNSFGCTAFLAHVACAFQFNYHWSHTAAYAETVRQTAEFTGWNWGGGLFINYAFALVWWSDVVVSWACPARQLRRAAWSTWSVRAVFLFMIFNGAVVFVHGPRRWFGSALCLALAVCWWTKRKRIADNLPPSKPA